MMPSLPKLIALAAVLWTVWKLFRIIERRNEIAKATSAEQQDANNSARTSESEAQEDKKKTGSLDLEECAECGSWVIPPCDCKDRPAE